MGWTGARCMARPIGWSTRSPIASIERIDEMLDRPAVDPHGDPIPTVGGEPRPAPHEALAELIVGGTGRVARIADQSRGSCLARRTPRTPPRHQGQGRPRDEDADTLEIQVGRGARARLGFARGGEDSDRAGLTRYTREVNATFGGLASTRHGSSRRASTSKRPGSRPTHSSVIGADAKNATWYLPVRVVRTAAARAKHSCEASGLDRSRRCLPGSARTLASRARH